MTQSQRNGIIAFPDFATPLGSLRLGGRLLGTQGTGLQAFRRFQEFAVVLVLGSGRYENAAGWSVRLSPGDVILVIPDHPHRYGPEAGDVWHELFVTFTGPIGDLWYRHGLDQRLPVWSVGDPQPWIRRWERLLRPPPHLTAACRRVGTLHALLADLAALRPGNGDPAWLVQARHDLGQPGAGLSMPAIARRAGLSDDGFRRAFRRAVGETPAAFRRRCRLEAVGRLLVRQELTLSQIADATGFSDAFHLSKVWKQTTGSSPRGTTRN